MTILLFMLQAFAGNQYNESKKFIDKKSDKKHCGYREKMWKARYKDKPYFGLYRHSSRQFKIKRDKKD